MPPQRVWTNSVFGRTLCTVFGLFCFILPFGTTPENGQSWHGSSILVDVSIILVGAAVIVAVWTSRLTLSDGVLTATNFFISRSIPLVEVVDVDPAALPFLGMKIRRGDKSGIRTLVSGQSWDELWTTRAEKISREIVEMATEARAVSIAESGPPVDLGTREWNTFQWLGASVVVLALGVVSLAAGVAALSESWSADRVQALLGLLGGPVLIGMGILGLVLLRPKPAARDSGRHAKE